MLQDSSVWIFSLQSITILWCLYCQVALYYITHISLYVELAVYCSIYVHYNNLVSLYIKPAMNYNIQVFIVYFEVSMYNKLLYFQLRPVRRRVWGQSLQCHRRTPPTTWGQHCSTQHSLVQFCLTYWTSTCPTGFYTGGYSG